jgi:hypothetical protein
LALILAASYTGWTFYSRYLADQEAVQKARESERLEDQKLVDRMGGSKLKILSFYASPMTATAGGKVLLCFGVVNATEVSIVPEIEPIKPALSHCLETHLTKSTTFTLKARDASGGEVTQTAAVEIR